MSTSGKLFTATIGVGTPITISGLTRGEIRDVGDELDSTDSDSAPYLDTDIGCVGKTGALEGHFRVEGMQFPALSMGTILTTLKIYPHGILADAYIFPLAIVLPGSVAVEVRGKVQFTINWASKGAFTEPSSV